VNGAPAALNPADDGPLSVKIRPAASSASAVIPPIAVTAVMPPVPKAASRLPPGLQRASALCAGHLPAQALALTSTNGLPVAPPYEPSALDRRFLKA
jgi:hypothetical protein